MKTIHKPAVCFMLLSAAVYLLWFMLNNTLVPVLNFPGNDVINSFFKHQAFLTVISIPTIISLAVYVSSKREAKLMRQYYDLFSCNPTPMCIVDIETRRFLEVNKATLECYGYVNEEFLKMTVNDIMADNEPIISENRFKTMNYGFKQADISKHRKKNGEIIVTQVSRSEISFKKKKCHLFLAADITEIVKAREEKKTAEEEKILHKNFAAFVLHNFPVDVAVFNKDHRYIFLNKTAVKDDDTRKWMIGKDDFDYFRRKGTDMTIAEKRRDRFIKAIAGESTEWIDEHTVNGQLKYILRKFFPYHEDGKLKYIYGYGTDITEIKKGQIQRDVYLAQLEKMAFTTSHEIRHPICNLQGLISILEGLEFEGEEVKKIVGFMRISVNRMDDCTKDLATRLHEYRQNLSVANSSTELGR